MIYLSHTKPDITFASSVVMHSPCEEHLEVVNQIIRYLKFTPSKGLFFKKKEESSVEAFTDANWAGSIESKRSTSDYFKMLWWNLVSWRSKKQPVATSSSVEAEFRAFARGTCELIWLKRLMEEKAAVSITYNPVHHDRTKHVEIDHNFIKENIEDGVICFTNLA